MEPTTKRPLKSWSARLKNTAVQIEGTCIIKKQSNTKGSGQSTYRYSCVMGSEPLSNSQPTRWSLIMERLTYAMMVGICSQKQSSEKLFADWGWANGHHGNYVVQCDGLSFSHLQNFNNKKQNLTFKSGDKLDLCYDPYKQEVSIRRQEIELIIPVDKLSQGDRYRICVYMYTIGDIVRIVYL